MAASITVQQALVNTYLLATGKATPPDISSNKGQRILGLLNYFSQDWASDRNTDWHSMRQIYTIPSVVTATDTFSLASFNLLNHISRQEGDFVRIYGTDGNSEWDYTIVEPQRLYADGPSLNNGGISTASAFGTCAQMGTNLVFSTPFLPGDAMIGGTIKFPGYGQPPILANLTDFLGVDDPEWLCSQVAAEYVRNDVTRVQLYPSLLSIANERLEDMRTANESQIEQGYTGSGWTASMGVTWS